MQTRAGQSIEDASMAVIESEVGEHPYDDSQWPVVRRVIHSTADFDFAGDNAIIFGGAAITEGIAAIRRGCNIVTDVNGIPGLLNKTTLAEFGIHTICRISQSDIAQRAKDMNTTRARASMRESAKDMDHAILAIGNAPTALLEATSMIRQNVTRPALVVGVPVGFIQAAESKDILAGTAIPHITNRGRKGGSSVAAAILNALLLQARLSL